MRLWIYTCGFQYQFLKGKKWIDRSFIPQKLYIRLVLLDLAERIFQSQHKLLSRKCSWIWSNKVHLHTPRPSISWWICWRLTSKADQMIFVNLTGVITNFANYANKVWFVLQCLLVQSIPGPLATCGISKIVSVNCDLKTCILDWFFLLQNAAMETDKECKKL